MRITGTVQKIIHGTLGEFKASEPSSVLLTNVYVDNLKVELSLEESNNKSEGYKITLDLKNVYVGDALINGDLAKAIASNVDLGAKITLKLEDGSCEFRSKLTSVEIESEE